MPCCPYCASNEVIQRGTRKNKLQTVQVYSCKKCNRRFSDGSEHIDQRIVALQSRIQEIEIANKTLLQNNVVMAESNKKLRDENNILLARVSHTEEALAKTEMERRNCKQKCEVIVSEKDRIIREKETRLANLKSVKEILDNAKWTRHVSDIPNGIEITNTVKYA